MQTQAGVAGKLAKAGDTTRNAQTAPFILRLVLATAALSHVLTIFAVILCQSNSQKLISAAGKSLL